MYEHYQGSSAEYCIFRSFGKLSQLLKCESFFNANICKTGSFLRLVMFFFATPSYFAFIAQSKLAISLFCGATKSKHAIAISFPCLGGWCKISKYKTYSIVNLFFHFSNTSPTVYMINIQTYGVRDPNPP